MTLFQAVLTSHFTLSSSIGGGVAVVAVVVAVTDSHT